MTVAHLHPDLGSQALARVEDARGEVTAGSALPPGELDDGQLASAIASLAGLESQVQAWKLALAAEADRRNVAEESADTGTEAWLAKLTGERREVLKGGLILAKRLQERYHQVRQALNDGAIRLEQARVIVRGLAVSEDDATPAQQAKAEEILINKATGAASPTGTPMTLKGLRSSAKRAYALIDAELSERHLTRSTKQDERVGDSDTWLISGSKGDGRYVGKFSIPERHGQMLQSFLQRLHAPRRLRRDAAGNLVVDQSVDTSNYYELQGRAFCELIEHLPDDGLPKASQTLIVRIDLDTLRRELAESGVGTATTGADLTPDEARRIACEAGIVPAVLDGASQPLHLGRTKRLHNEKQRQALSLLFDSCAVAGCDRPFSWTEIHHPEAWSDGGSTDLDNALPLCWHHHRAAHRTDRWTLTRHSLTEWTLEPVRRRRPPPASSSRYVFKPAG